MGVEPPAFRSGGACAACGTALPSSLLACPHCGRLVHAERLKSLAADAERAEGAGRAGEAVLAWREALRLLPADAPQAAAVGERIDALLSRPEVRRDPALRRRAVGAGALRGLAGAGLLGVLVAGLTKLPALAGIAGMFGVLWAAYGWALAAGVLASLYVHELGHVVAMWRRGLPVTAPMFVPGLGAYVRLTERPATVAEDNRIGLAGPLAGLGAAAAAWAGGVVLDLPLLLAIARVGALLNLFNLTPLWQLDGARGFASLVRWQRLAVTLAFGVALAATGERLLVLPGFVAAVATVGGRPAEKPDAVGFATFLALVALLAPLAALDVPVGN